MPRWLTRTGVLVAVGIVSAGIAWRFGSGSDGAGQIVGEANCGDHICAGGVLETCQTCPSDCRCAYCCQNLECSLSTTMPVAPNPACSYYGWGNTADQTLAQNTCNSVCNLCLSAGSPCGGNNCCAGLSCQSGTCMAAQTSSGPTQSSSAPASSAPASSVASSQGPTPFSCGNGMLHLATNLSLTDAKIMLITSNGSVTWNRPFDGQFHATLAVNDSGEIYAVKVLNGTSTLVKITMPNGTVTPIGPLAPGGALDGNTNAMAFAPDGTLYVTNDDTKRMYEVDLSSGLATPVHAFGGELVMQGGDFVFTGNTTFVYIVANGSAYAIDMSSWSVTQLGTSTRHFTSMMGLNDDLFGIDSNAKALVRVDTNPFVLTEITTNAEFSYGDGAGCPPDQQQNSSSSSGGVGSSSQGGGSSTGGTSSAVSSSRASSVSSSNNSNGSNNSNASGGSTQSQGSSAGGSSAGSTGSSGTSSAGSTGSNNSYASTGSSGSNGSTGSSASTGSTGSVGSNRSGSSIRSVSSTQTSSVVSGGSNGSTGSSGSNASGGSTGSTGSNASGGSNPSTGSNGSNASGGNSSNTLALASVCGNGFRELGEDCDDGNRDPSDGCTNACRLPGCGDGVLGAGEHCDEGVYNGDFPDACRMNCRLPACGDDIIDTGEACDDGNTENADGCSNACLLGERQACIRSNDCASGLCVDGFCVGKDLCGNGVREGREWCDGESGCSASCVWLVDAACTSDEQCGSGFCSGGICAVRPVCGDGVVQAGEACDQGPGNSNVIPNRCRLSCMVASIGDGVIDSGEECDDGNVKGGDGCSGEGRSELVAGDETQNGAITGLIDGRPLFASYGGIGTLPAVLLSPPLPAALVGMTDSRHAGAPVANPETGPAAVLLMASGAAGGLAWIRRRRG